MAVGEVANLTVQHDYGYGVAGLPPRIPTYAVLHFEVRTHKRFPVADFSRDVSERRLLVVAGGAAVDRGRAAAGRGRRWSAGAPGRGRRRHRRAGQRAVTTRRSLPTSTSSPLIFRAESFLPFAGSILQRRRRKRGPHCNGRWQPCETRPSGADRREQGRELVAYYKLAGDERGRAKEVSSCHFFLVLNESLKSPI